MIPNKTGQIVKFHIPLKGEDSQQQYVVLDIHNGADVSKAKIQALNTGLPLAPISMVNLTDLEVVHVSTEDLIGHAVFIKTVNGEKILGRIISAKDKFIDLNLDQNLDSIETNVFVTVIDKDGVEHSGMLLVN